MNKIYVICDKVSETVETVIIANNDKDCLRKLVFGGFFKLNRFEDVDIFETEYKLEYNDISLNVKLDKENLLEELKMHIENKAKDVDKDELKDKLEETSNKGA